MAFCQDLSGTECKQGIRGRTPLKNVVRWYGGRCSLELNKDIHFRDAVGGENACGMFAQTDNFLFGEN